MPSTESIILENWPVSDDHQRGDRPVCHFALKQTGVNLDFHLRQYFRHFRLFLHYFDTFDDLVKICHRHHVSAIMIGGRADFFREIDLVRAIKDNILISIVPVILYHPEPDTSTIVAAYQNGVEDFIYGEWIDKLVEVRIGRVIERSHRDLSVNPSTSLPGPAIIEEEINRQLRRKDRFAVCYVDLDNFKAYNDYYGYVHGDKVIRMTGRILRDIVFDLAPEGFVGHVAGDDFICVMPAETARVACLWIIKCFDAFIYYRYEEADRNRGYIDTRNRKGEIERYPILSISISVIINENGEFEHIGELSKQLADLKRATKAMSGSNYMIERRKKY